MFFALTLNLFAIESETVVVHNSTLKLLLHLPDPRIGIHFAAGVFHH